MTLQELQKILTSRNGRLRLDATTGLSSVPSIAALCRDYFGGIFDVTLSPPPSPQPSKFSYGSQARDSVHVTGTLMSDFLGCPGVKVEANFFLMDGSAEVVITLQNPRPSWTLSSVFPDVQSSELGRVTFREGIFTLDSKRPYSLGKDFDALFQPEDEQPPLRKGR
jgi:hypothetical protein